MNGEFYSNLQLTRVNLVMTSPPVHCNGGPLAHQHHMKDNRTHWSTNQCLFLATTLWIFQARKVLKRTTWWWCGVPIILPGFRKFLSCIYCFYLPPPVLVLYHLVVDRDRSLHIPWNYRCKRWHFNNLPLKPRNGARKNRWAHTRFIVKLSGMACWVVQF